MHIFHSAEYTDTHTLLTSIQFPLISAWKTLTHPSVPNSDVSSVMPSSPSQVECIIQHPSSSAPMIRIQIPAEELVLL